MSASANGVGVRRTRMATMIDRLEWTDKSENRQGKLATVGRRHDGCGPLVCRAMAVAGLAAFDCTLPVSASSIGDGGNLTVRIVGFIVTSHQKGPRFIVRRGRYQ
jgi:hypothetical protein